MTELSGKARKWLDHIRLSTDGAGMYPGTRCRDVPNKVSRRLSAAGFITSFIPHNPDHLERWIITHAGREALQARDR